MSNIITFPLENEYSPELSGGTKKSTSMNKVEETQTRSTLDILRGRALEDGDFRGVQICPLCKTVSIGPYCLSNNCKYYWIKIPQPVDNIEKFKTP